MEDNEYATSEYIVWYPLGLTCAHHPLVQQAKKSFWQQRSTLPKYYGIYSDEQVLKYNSYLGENIYIYIFIYIYIRCHHAPPSRTGGRPVNFIILSPWTKNYVH